MSKMCSNIPVQDCQVANSVEYCYCRGELCNKQQSQQPPSNQVPKATATRRPPPAPTPDTPISTKAPKAPSRPRGSDEEVHRAHDLHQLSTSGPEEPPPAAGAAGLRGLAAGVALALLACRHILTPNIA